MNFVRIAALGAAMLMLGLAAAGCGGDDGGDDPPAATEPAATATTAAPVATEPASTATSAAPEATSTTAVSTATEPPAGPVEVAVAAADLSFTPPSFTINGDADTTVTLTNRGALPHTMHVYRDQAYTDAVANTGTLNAGNTGELTITSTDIGAATQMFFRCNIHQQAMQGTITVE